jgi:predicted deacylase
MQRLGRNVASYSGETIDIQKVLHEIQSAALKHNWRQDCFLKSEEFSLLAYHRTSGQARKRIYISSGIHGDEPAGPLAVRELALQNRWPEGIDVWLCPCLNPTGFPMNRRESAQGLDLNRQYLHLEADETKAHVLWLEQQPSFDVVLCLHEDWEAKGFYVYELNPDHQPSFAEEMIRRVSEVCPIDRSPVIEAREAREGIIRPSADPLSRPQWPEAFYLLTHKTRLSYTLEAPSDYPMSVRVAALVTGVRAVLELISK